MIDAEGLTDWPHSATSTLSLLKLILYFIPAGPSNPTQFSLFNPGRTSDFEPDNE
jgi:hypothetical protein